MPSPVAAPVFLILTVYAALRFANFVDIWSEVGKANKKVEMELATYLTDQLEPFSQEMSEHFDVPNEEGVPELSDNLESSEDFEEIDWNLAFDQMGMNPIEMASDFMGAMSETMGTDVSAIQGSPSKPIPAQYLVESDQIDPSEVFDDVRDFYRRYRRISQSQGYAEYALISFAVSSLGMTFASLFSISLDLRFVMGYVTIIVLWLLLELYLWILLNREVEVSGRTPIDKLITKTLLDMI